MLTASLGCKKYLDINNNPNGPSQADPALYLPSIQANYAQGIQFDARLIGPYLQNFLATIPQAPLLIGMDTFQGATLAPVCGEMYIGKADLIHWI
ncbi:MAG: hypothetical protein WKF59_03605 [Chitinophagaceae bacterium]